MIPTFDSLNRWLRLAAVATTATIAGCALNPFGSDDQPRRANPVATGAPPPSAASTSMNAGGTAAAQDSYEPRLVRVDEPVPLAEGHPDEYVVQVGDTLWDIAATFLKDPWFWPEIWYVNPEIANPHLIYPGDVLALVTIDGQPRITTVRGSTYRLSPQARVTPLTEAVSSIPYEAVQAFLSKGIVLERDEVDRLPYLLSSRGDHLVAAAGNDVYVRGTGGESIGSRYGVVSVGDPLVDPDDNRVVGYQGIWVGEGTMRRGGDPATMRLNETTREAKVGDRLIPEAVEIPLNFFPKAPSNVIDGRIISVVGGVTQIGQYQVVVINRGSRDGLAIGDVLSVFQYGETIRDRIAGGSVKLPDEEAGTVMVFKVYDEIGYGLVMEASQAIHIHDAVRNPI
ncbi:MAG: LysM peptidoglycan-binding domain-containing protein [Woeseiaceae bacterium]|nr:LysM peptidoglycan-binding domain-containing protein [Woeseiaceae bacterium]